ncbi:hypothetical protein NUU61_003957 [Penicillium alfredii]|uniref:Uncharacterized protein n=1 Tax=Penicillium alfredii TaxID=1506179 RepID=A0A9W9FKD9_9EURO|nr:uncharacterized protein NUU61_003957 [Penicillium alfredii]KAJ5101735.1 hypothetical protein NUU61_003957 [Penicillium alfredii]
MSRRADEELGKKDDDHRLSEPARFQPLRHGKFARPRRLIAILIVLVVVHQFFKHMPTDLSPAAERYNPTIAKLRHQNPVRPADSEKYSEKGSEKAPGNGQGRGFDKDPGKPPVIPEERPQRQGHQREPQNSEGSYDEGIKFYELARSLPRDKHPENGSSREVVFAASSLRSVSDLLPLACRMAGRGLNHVHFVLMGKEEVSIEGIKKVIGIKDPECPMTWHDSRPDHAPQSTNSRMERAVSGGLGFIQTYLQPEVVITQGKNWEDPFFWDGVEAHAKETGTPHIGLSSASRDLMWVASMDSTALRVWNDLRIDMVVHASESTGSLTKLLQSLDAADYLGSTPQLTIEIPPQVDSQLLQLLRREGDGLSQLAGRITLRRRIQQRSTDATESSLRTVESFYPYDPTVSHVLILSPQAELGPSFYHYLKYTTLHYKHSSHSQRLSAKLLGISLELPSSKPTADSEQFTPPSTPIMNHAESGEQEFLPSFLWQAPNSNAALYFGDKWVEFHSFLSSRLATPTAQPAGDSQGKLMSTTYPSFMEYLLEMIRAKGYSMVYPSFPGRKSSPLATIHTELYQPPGFTQGTGPVRPGEQSFKVIEDPNQPLTLEGTDTLGTVEEPLNRVSTIMPLLDLFSMDLPGLDSLPLLSYDGKDLTTQADTQQTKEYAREFRIRYGGCTDDSTADDPSADLFCLNK